MPTDAPFTPTRPGGLTVFFTVAGALLLLRVILAYDLFPPGMVQVVALVVSVMFVGLPIYALFRGVDWGWTAGRAFALLGSGVALHVTGALLTRNVLPEAGLTTVVVDSVAQLGLIMWCLALGVLLSLLIRDKNLLLPVAIFLAGFDVFLIFYPGTITQRMIHVSPAFFEGVAMSVPAVRERPDTARRAPRAQVEAMARIGPADLFFIATFFACLFRFRMRVRETAKWLVPVLFAYLAIVLLFGSVRLGAFSLALLPAMVPIGLTVLLVNRREFQLSAEEKQATWGVAVIAIGLAVWALVARANYVPPPPVRDGSPAQPPAPSTGTAAPGASALPGSPPPGAASQPP